MQEEPSDFREVDTDESIAATNPEALLDVDFSELEETPTDESPAFRRRILQAREAISEMRDSQMVLPDGARRSFLQAAGVAGTASLAGCLDALDGDEVDEDDDVDEETRMTYDWVPKRILKELDIQVAFNSEEIFFRFQWEQPDPGGWLHDMLVYQDGEWQRFAGPSPWVPAEQDPDEHTGYTEDRLSFFLDDGSVRGFENFGGWMTVHKGVQTLPDAADGADVETHPHLGEQLDQSDVRKYIPQSREGEWWENDWDAVLSQEELDQLKEDGVFLDLAMWRAHRSNPVGLCSDHHVLEHRHSDDGTSAHTTQDWDPEEGPEYMFDPDVVDGGALDYNEIQEGNIPDQQEDVYWLERGDDGNMVEFDPEVAEWEGAMIPRRPLNPPEATDGSVVDWTTPTGIWEDGQWTVVMKRELQTGHVDTKALEPGDVYTWSPAIHHGVGARWHWVAYPYKLGLGDDVEADLTAVEVDGEPEWDDLPVQTIPLLYPGQVDWTWLTSDQHPAFNLVRNNELGIWDFHEEPRRLAARLVGLEVQEAPRE